MSEEPQKTIDVYETNRFAKSLKKMPKQQLSLVEDEIEKIISDPEIGERKKGDLSYLRVHKFKLSGQLVLLGYSWYDQQLKLILLDIGPHENFYQKASNKRDTDLDFIDTLLDS